LLDEITLAARRDICAGEEITADLAMWWEPDDVSVPPWMCNCGTSLCRKVFTSRDWRRPELYCRYGDHFLPYINQRIKDLQAMTRPEFEIVIPTPDAGPKLLQMAHSVALFLPDDFDVIQELWDEFAAKGDAASHYHFVTAQQADEILGFACYGRRPLTEATFDLYWIGVSQQHQGRGIGKALSHVVEDSIRAMGGRLLIAETEGKPSFEPTRRFYLSAGYEIEARIRDFYRAGEDLFIFVKRL
jgi:ribosomal protein S18 acetylase RimI-like enzyme